jgi:hypothetical protein
MAVDGVVSSIIPERTLVVRISDLASGYERLTWRTAWRALKSAAGALPIRLFTPVRPALTRWRTLPAVMIFSVDFCVSVLRMRRLICSWLANQD